VGTRRAELLLQTARQLSYTEQYSETEGWNDNVGVELLNLGQDKLYKAITEIDNPANIEEYVQDVVSGQQSYDIPMEVQMYVRIMDVRFIWGTQAYEFVTLNQGMIQDRLDFPINIPSTYCIRNGKILLSPTPNITKEASLVINYQKRMRSLDVRRGRVVSRTLNPVVFTLSFTAQSEKDANMRANADSVLDKVDYCCIVDVHGEPVVSGIPIFNYDFDAQEINALPDYVIPAAQLAALDQAIMAGDQLYVTQGIYSSTNSQLDSQCDDFIIEYTVKRFLRLQSNTSEMEQAMLEEEQTLKSLVNQYRRYRPTQYPIRWMQNYRNTSYPFGSRGVY
jgi:hypothetical protein